MNDNRASKVQIEKITITEDALVPDGRSPAELALMVRLYNLALDNPDKSISELLAAIKKYPHIPQLYQTLTAAYQVLGATEKRNEWAKKTYARFPDYLFAKCGYAQLKMQEGFMGEVPLIFNNTFSLQALYPERSVFHVSEVMVHANCMATYFYKIKNFDAMRAYIDVMRQIDPDRMTKMELE